MERIEVAKLLDYLSKAYPKFEIVDMEGTLDTWADLLEPYRDEDVLRAAKYHARHNRFFPAVSELVENIMPAAYEEKGIPEEPEDPEKIRTDTSRAIKAEESRLKRKLSEEECRKIKADVIKIDEIRRKNTRPFQPPPTIILTDEDVEVISEWLDWSDN